MQLLEQQPAAADPLPMIREGSSPGHAEPQQYADATADGDVCMLDQGVAARAREEYARLLQAAGAGIFSNCRPR